MNRNYMKGGSNNNRVAISHNNFDPKNQLLIQRGHGESISAVKKSQNNFNAVTKQIDDQETYIDVQNNIIGGGEMSG